MRKQTIIETNWRARVAILTAKLTGLRDGATMAEIRDALNQRRNMRERHITSVEAHELRCHFLRQNAPDLL